MLVSAHLDLIDQGTIPKDRDLVPLYATFLQVIRVIIYLVPEESVVESFLAYLTLRHQGCRSFHSATVAF